MSLSKTLLVAFDPSKHQSQSSDFLVPWIVKGQVSLYGLKSKTVQPLGMVVYVGRPVTESDLFAKLIDLGEKISSVDDALAQLRQYFEQLQSLRIGNVVRLEAGNDGNAKLVVLSKTPSGFDNELRQRE